MFFTETWWKEIAHCSGLLLSWVITLITLLSSVSLYVLWNREEFLSGSSFQEHFLKSISVPIIIKIISASSKTFCLDSSLKSQERIKINSNDIHGLAFNGLAFHIRDLGFLKISRDT